MATEKELLMKRTEKQKNDLIDGLKFAAQFLANLFKFAKKYNLSNERLYNSLKEEDFAEKIIKSITDSVKSFKLKFLKKLGTVSVSSEEFKKSDFFTNNGPVRLWMSDNFKTYILSEISDTIHARDTTLTKLILSQSMTDAEIRAEIGEDNIATPTGWAQEFMSLLQEQSRGEKGTLLNSGYANIRYVKTTNGEVFAVDANWDADDHEWFLDACELDVYRWLDGFYVFAGS